AGLYLYAQSRELAPVDYGNLKASAVVRSSGPLNVEVAYTASYAVYVHENMDALHGAAFNSAYAKQLSSHPKKGPFRHNRGENQQAKFLEVAARRGIGDIRLIIKG